MTTRTVSEVTAAITMCEKALANTEGHMAELRNADRLNLGWYVVGWPNGLFVNGTMSNHSVGGLFFATKLGNRAWMYARDLRNGAGERAQAYTWHQACHIALGVQEEAKQEYLRCLDMLQDELREANRAAEVVQLRAEAVQLRAELLARAAEQAKLERELKRHRAAVAVAEEYFDDRADADCDSEGWHGNAEMRAVSHMRAILEGYVS